MALWIKNSLLALLGMAVLITIILAVGASRLKRETQALTQQMTRLASTKSSTVDFGSFAELPRPVQRYFRNVLGENPRIIRLARVQQTGVLEINPQAEKWTPFTATHMAAVNPAGFIWDAKINITPGFHVRVRDSFVNGVGGGKVSLLSAIPMGGERDFPEINSGALYRYLAESVWYPTALLPQSGVRWQAVDEHRAVAHLAESGISVSLEFRFNDVGEATGVYTEDRFGKFGDAYVKYPWEGRFRNYRRFNGVKIPTEGEVGWHLPQGWWMFLQCKIESVDFEFSETLLTSTTIKDLH